MEVWDRQGQGLVLAAPALQPVHARGRGHRRRRPRGGLPAGRRRAGDAGRQGPRRDDAEDLSGRGPVRLVGLEPLGAPPARLRPEFRYDGPQGDGAERTEKVGEASEAPAANSTNVVSRPKVLGGSLPRLRYGRSYAFRAWGVDLAGNSPRPEVPPSLDVAVTMADAAGPGETAPGPSPAPASACRPRRLAASSSPAGRAPIPTVSSPGCGVPRPAGWRTWPRRGLTTSTRRRSCRPWSAGWRVARRRAPRAPSMV